MSDAEPVVKPLRGRETCGHCETGKFGFLVCRLLVFTHGEEVVCLFMDTTNPCPIAERVRELEAKLARVEALLPKWREQVRESGLQADWEWARGDPYGTGASCDGSWMALEEKCDELEAALRGEEARPMPYDPHRDPESPVCHEDERRAEQLLAMYHCGELYEEYGRYCYYHGEPLSEEFLADYLEREATNGG
jgi:hypothetical protein